MEHVRSDHAVTWRRLREGRRLVPRHSGDVGATSCPRQHAEVRDHNGHDVGEGGLHPDDCGHVAADHDVELIDAEEQGPYHQRDHHCPA